MKQKIKLFFLVLSLLTGAAGLSARAATDVFTASGTWTAPVGVTSVDVEVWGGGGAGGGNPTNVDGGGGGGGGAYSSSTAIPVTPGTTYTVTVGAGGVGVNMADGGAGGDSWFINAATILARGGAGGMAPVFGAGGLGGAGGAAAAGVGTLRYSGGDGGTGRNSNTGRGGPGGSSAGTAANGTSGPNPWNTCTAAAAPAGGGIGGDGGCANRQDGFAPASGNGGGGGGGAERQTMGGNGAPGMVTITYAGGGAGTVTAYPTLCVNDTGIGTQAWGGLMNATALDNAYATALASNSQITNYLKCTGYNFAIPVGATITGITVGPWVNATWTFTVNAMQLVKADVIQPTNLAVGDTIPNGGGAMRPAPTQLLFGSSTNLWGDTWTPADINDATFGAAFAAQRGPYITSQTVGVDAMPITIDYTTSGGGTPTTVTYYHDTTNGVAIGVDGPTNVVSGTNVTIPPIITASLITANTCTGNARSQNHPAGLYTHSRWYLTTDYATATEISANPTGSARLRGRRTSDTVTVSLYDYDPVSGAKTLIGSSTPISIDGNTVNYPYTINSPLYTVPAGHRLMLQYDFDQLASGDRARVYCSSTGSYITVTETPVSVPVAEYRMDEASWNGTANEVLDSSGNALHGTAFLGATTAAARICNGANLAANYVEVPDNALLDITNGLTVTAWIRPARWGGPPGDTLMSFLSKDTNYEVHVNATGNILWWWGTGNITSAATAPVGAWTHVAMVYLDGSQTLYINGVASGTNTVAGALPTNALPLQIGDDQGFGGGTRRFDGMIDEVKIFSNALSPSQIATGYANENAGNNWDGSVRVCPVYAPDHLEIQHASGTGLTCAASTLTIMACADNANPCTPYTAGVTGTLSATGTPTVNWDGGTGFVIPSGSSSVTKNVQVATAGTVAFGVSTATPAPTGATTCNYGNNAPANDNCVFTASTAGFLFSDTTTGAAYIIPAQVSGTASGTLYLRAVQASTTNPAVCTPAIIGQTTAVTMGYTCNNPATCQAGNLTTINTTAIAPGGTSVNLTFDANGSAPITVRYDDAGQITLGANKTVTPFGGATAITLVGDSGAFIVAPHHFGFSGVTAGPIRAGNNFSATVTAYNNLATPTVTANFGQETTAEGVTLSFSRCQPTGTSAVNGTFSGSVGAFANGVATAANLNWSEVGNGDLVATLTSGGYLGSTLTVTGNTGTGGTVCNGAGNVGNFIPDHFDTIVTGPMTCPVGLTCPSGGLVYSGLPFITNVYARNAAGAITQNYDGTANTTPNFARAVTLEAWDGVGSTTTQNPPAASGSSITAGGAIAAGAFSQGTTLAPGTPGAPVYTFGTTPTDPTDIYLRAIDTDGVTSLTAASNEGGVKVVNGRIKVSNAYGSELLPLTLSATAQYYTANGWTNSTTDSVTTLTVPGNYTVGTGTSTTTLTPATGILAQGVLSIRLGPPSGGATGVATVVPAVVGCAIPATCYLPVIQGTATFGVYNNNNGFIYRRESY